MSESQTDNPTVGKPLAPSRRRCWLSLLLMTVIFVSGGFIGAGLTIISRPERPRGRRTLEEARDRFTEKIADRRDLSEQQIEQVRQIVHERLLAGQKLRKKIQPEMETQWILLKEKVGALLNAEQAQEWEKYYTELHDRWTPEKTSTKPSTQPTKDD